MLFFFQKALIVCIAQLFIWGVGAQDTQNQIPRAYRGMALGMSAEKVKEQISTDSWFNYRGDASLSLLERPRASVIDAGGSLFIARGLFQFESDELAAIILELNSETIDWYTVYTTLETKYGLPNVMDPSKAWWDDGVTRLVLERPLTVKYLDMKVFQMENQEKKDRLTWREESRNNFLYEF